MKKIIITLLLLSLILLLINIPVVTVGESDKVIYLTFDDGPSDNTERILDILKAYDVKATFFVVRREGYDNLYRRIVNEGHTLGGHSSSHRYSQIYRSVNSYYTDLNALSNYVYSLTRYRFNIIRFPGGSNNTISIRYSDIDVMSRITAQASYEGYIYYDWNVDSLDAIGLLNSIDIANNVITGCKPYNMSIVLMHDSPRKITTPDSLPIIINTMLVKGYRFDRITNETKAIKFI